MKWIELIRVRSSETALSDGMPGLRAQLQEMEAAVEHVEVLVLQHALYDGDAAVVIVWRTGDPPQKSQEGLQVAQWLSRLGSIDHAVWSPTPQRTHER